MNDIPTKMRAHRMGIDTYQEPVVYMRADCHVCRSEGFNAQSRIRVSTDQREILATLDVVHTDLLEMDAAGLSEAAWRLLGASEGQALHFAHPRPLDSFRDVRAKLYGKALDEDAYTRIVKDVAAGRYSDVQLAAFASATMTDRLGIEELIALTRAMVAAGDRLRWDEPQVMDKHCVGGLAGNRTSPIIVAIVAAQGLIMPKTSSRAITSPAGTADTMEVLTRVNLSLAEMRRVVEQENACLVWGGSVDLSPADDMLIRVERALQIDSVPQLVASILSKKAAAGSTHVIIDMPVGPSAKIRDEDTAVRVRDLLVRVGDALGIAVDVVRTEGRQPVGRGVGPALEARDVLAVLGRNPYAPADLRERAVTLAGRILEIGGAAEEGEGIEMAHGCLDSGRAWAKFQSICEAQGGMREPASAPHRRDIVADHAGVVDHIENLGISRVAKLAGAPDARTAGIQLHVHLGDTVLAGDPLFTIHAESRGELEYALDFLAEHQGIIGLAEGGA